MEREEGREGGREGGREEGGMEGEREKRGREEGGRVREREEREGKRRRKTKGGLLTFQISMNDAIFMEVDDAENDLS